jgi:hypothetical protein
VFPGGTSISGSVCTRFGGLLVFLRLDLGQCDRQIFKRQLPLILGQLFRLFAMQSVVQLGDEMLLPPRDILKQCDRFHQRRNDRALRGRYGGKVYGGYSNHAQGLL